MKQPESPDIGGIKDMVQHRLNIAAEDLETAKILFDATQFRGANNRAYYSIFHSICAILSIEGKAFKRHKDTLAYFNKEYVRTEIFPRDLGRRIVKAEEIRHASDYDTFYIASKEVTSKQIETASQLLILAEQYFALHSSELSE